MKNSTIVNGLNTTILKRLNFLLIVIILSCNQISNNKSIKIYSSLNSECQEFIINTSIKDDFYYYQYQNKNNKLNQSYILNFKLKDFKNITINDTFYMKIENEKYFDVKKMKFKVVNFSGKSYKYGYKLRFFWNEKYGIFYIYNGADVIYQKNIFSDSIDNSIVNCLIEQIRNDFNFIYNVEFPDRLLEK